MALPPPEPAPRRAADIANDPVALSVLGSIMTVALMSPMFEAMSEEQRQDAIAQIAYQGADRVRKEVRLELELERMMGEGS